jgi:single-strand DNA-binding protein
MYGRIEPAFIGKLGRDPELKRVKDNTMAVLNMSVVVGGNRDKGEEGQWLKVTVFRERVEELSTQLKKGDEVYVEGNLKLDAWTGKEGEQRNGLSVAANKCEPLAKIGRNKPAQTPRTETLSATNNGGWQEPLNDTIPF